MSEPEEFVRERPWGNWSSPSPSISPAQEEGQPPAPAEEDETEED